MSSTLPMTYRDHAQTQAYAQNRPRPLIEQIPDYRDDLDVSDEEDAFYTRDDDFLIPPKLQAVITRTSDRIPRRIKRHSLKYFVIFILSLISWYTYFGPRRAAQKAELYLMDNKPTMSYGNNVRPAFKGMIQVSDLDEQHLPKHNNRLIFVGDVHGCKHELEHLLKKVDFNPKHDHVVLVGDMIAKGPDSAGVIKLAQKIGGSCVRGNWEDKLLLSIAEAQDRHMLVIPEDEDATISFLDDSDHESATASAHANPALRRLAKQFTKTNQISIPVPRHPTRRSNTHPGPQTPQHHLICNNNNNNPRSRPRRPRSRHPTRRPRPLPRHEHAQHRPQDAHPQFKTRRHAMGEVLESSPGETGAQGEAWGKRNNNGGVWT
ncbi:hypothetical protein P3342_008698 [Pyrenophora teres f. teres]|nr:hypothetical protein P3342_008698 [Pyrenophora teres f. teres]